jgi:hypothetical protein
MRRTGREALHARRERSLFLSSGNTTLENDQCRRKPNRQLARRKSLGQPGSCTLPTRIKAPGALAARRGFVTCQRKTAGRQDPFRIYGQERRQTRSIGVPARAAQGPRLNPSKHLLNGNSTRAPPAFKEAAAWVMIQDHGAALCEFIEITIATDPQDGPSCERVRQSMRSALAILATFFSKRAQLNEGESTRPHDFQAIGIFVALLSQCPFIRNAFLGRHRDGNTANAQPRSQLIRE